MRRGPAHPVLGSLAALAAAAAMVAPTHAVDLPFTQTRTTGPQTLLIAYRVLPAKRAALRQIMLASGVARFQRWKDDGVLQDVHVLFNSYLDSDTFDMLALLTFGDYAAVAKWREIERVSPGGLSPAALELITSAVTYPLDAARGDRSPEPAVPGQSVFFVIPYDYLTSTDDYVRYVDTYVVPQAAGWMAEGVLASYTMYIARYATGRPWSSLLVLEYRDHDAFGRRDMTVQKVRDRLKRNPSWAAANDAKQKIRVEKQAIISEELLAR
jgi:hypothetical protein